MSGCEWITHSIIIIKEVKKHPKTECMTLPHTTEVGLTEEKGVTSLINYAVSFNKRKISYKMACIFFDGLKLVTTDSLLWPNFSCDSL